MKILNQFYREYKGEAKLSFITLAVSLILLIIFAQEEALLWFVGVLPWQVLYGIPVLLGTIVLFALIKNIRDHLDANKQQDQHKMKSTEGAVAMLMFALLFLGLVSYNTSIDLFTPGNPRNYTGECKVSLNQPLRRDRIFRSDRIYGQKFCSLEIDRTDLIAVNISCAKANELAGLSAGNQIEYEYLPCKTEVKATYLPATRVVLNIESN